MERQPKTKPGRYRLFVATGCLAITLGLGGFKLPAQDQAAGDELVATRLISLSDGRGLGVRV
jgi:hypothetical protein